MTETATRGKGPVKIFYKGNDSEDKLSHIPDDVNTVVFVSNYDESEIEIPMSFPENVMRAFVARSLANLIQTYVRNGADAEGSNIADLINDKVEQFKSGKAYARVVSEEGAERAPKEKRLDFGYWLPIFEAWSTMKAKAQGKGHDKATIDKNAKAIQDYFNVMKPRQANSILSQWKAKLPDFAAAVAQHDAQLATQRMASAPKMSVEDEMQMMFATKPRSKNA